MGRVGGDSAAARLRNDLVETVNRQREIVLSRLSGKSGIISPLFRVLLTIGALVWFPIVQPVLKIFLAGGSTLHSISDAAVMLVTILSAQWLLANAGLLVLWYRLSGAAAVEFAGEGESNAGEVEDGGAGGSVAEFEHTDLGVD